VADPGGAGGGGGLGEGGGVKRLLERLDRFWFEPARLTDLAIVRIVVVAMELLLLLSPYLADTVGACVGCSLPYQRWLVTLSGDQYRPLPTMQVLMLPLGRHARPELMFLEAVWLAAVVGGVGALIGRYTRLSLFALAAGSTLLTAHAYSYGERHHPEALLTIMLWTLVLVPSGARLSLDALLFRVRLARATGRFQQRPPEPELSPHARWPLRLMQVMLSLAYFSAGYSKLMNGGLAWLNGYTLAHYIAGDAIVRGSAFGVWLARHMALLRLMSVGALVIELGFWVVLFWPRLVWLGVVAGAGLHVGIYVLQRAPFPQFIALYVVFIDELRRYSPFRRRAAKPAPVWTVVYDGLCPLCIRTMTVLDALDWRHRLAFVDLERDWGRAAALAPGLSAGAARHAMHVVAPDGTVYRGYAAFRRLASVLPLLWPLAPLMALPLADRVGSAVYDGVARNRGRIPCRAETCAV
jgi:predicted DCC family thiol-disulfide oxidoreductase YuxK